MRKKRIAYIAKNLNVNGISSVIVNYCNYFSKKDYQIDVYAGEPINKNITKQCNNNSIKIVKTPPKKIKNFFKYIIFLKKNIKNYDIVHVHGNSCLILLELAIAKLNKNKKILAHSHSISCNNKPLHYLIKPFLNKFYDYGLACSKEAGKWMFSNKKFAVIPNGIKMENYKFNEDIRKKIRKELNIDNEFVIGHVGNFSDSKNYPFIIDFFSEICKVNNNYRLLLIGNYNNNIKLKNAIVSNKFADKIILYGISTNISELYNAMDCFVFPSKFEGLGIVLLEAEANGLKCIISPKIPSEVIIDKKLVSVIDINKKNVILWKKKVLNIKPHDRIKKYNQNYEKIKQYDIKNSMSYLEKIYKGDQNENL